MAFLDKRAHLSGRPIEAKDERGGRYRSVEIATPLETSRSASSSAPISALAPGFVDHGVGNASRPENVFASAQSIT